MRNLKSHQTCQKIRDKRRRFSITHSSNPIQCTLLVLIDFCPVQCELSSFFVQKASAAAAFYSAKSSQLNPIKGEEKMKSPRLQSSMFITLNTDGERIEYQVSEVCFVIFELFTSWFPHFRILHPAFLNQSKIIGLQNLQK